MNKAVSLPHALTGRPGCVILTFTKAAGSDARLWNESMARDFPGTLPGFAVMVLESVPRLFRGVTLSGIRGSMPAAMQERTLVLLKDEVLWKSRLGVQDAERAYVVLLGGNGHVRWLNSGAFARGGQAGMKSEIARLLNPATQ